MTRSNLLAVAGVLMMLGSPASRSVAQAAPPAPAVPPAGTASTPTAPTAPTAAAAPAAERPSHAEALKLGRLTFERAMAGNIDALLQSADSTLGAPEALRGRLETGLKQIGEQLGAEVAMSAESVMLVNGRVEYWRTSEYSLVPVPIVFRVILATGSSWRGFTANSEEQTPAGQAINP